MKYLFKVAKTASDGTQIVGHSNFKAHYAGLNDNLAWSTLQPSIRKATQEFLIPVIGQELYDDIAEMYNDGDVLSANQSEFLDACRDAVAYFAVYHGAPELNISISDMGVVEKGGNQGAMPAPQWRYKEFMYDVCRKADRALDRVVQLLDKYVAAGDTYFGLYTGSDVYQAGQSRYFLNADHLEAYQPINRSRRVFMALLEDIREAERYVESVICEDQADALQNSIVEDTLDATSRKLLERIRRAVAARAMANGAMRLAVTVEGGALYLSSYSDGYTSKGHFASAFKGTEAVGAFIAKARQDAERYMQELAVFVHRNIADYPLIQDSDCYAAYDPDTVSPVCTGDGGIMI